MLLFNSADTATLMNVALKNSFGTTTTADGASADGLTCQEDLTNFVQCGQAVNTALVNDPTLFYNTVTGMLETVADIYYENITSEEYDANKYELQVSSAEFAALKEKVRLSHDGFEASFVLDGSQSSTFDDLFGKHPFTFNVKVWGNKGIYRTRPFTISYEMFRTSVQSRASFDRLIAEMWSVIDAVMEIAVNESPYFLIFQQIANAALYRGGVRVINLAAEYEKEAGTGTFTSEDDPDFSAWFVRFQRHLRILMRRVTNKFSGSDDIKINTPKIHMRKMLIDDFYDKINKGLSGIYHDNKIGNIDDYELEPYIQNVNEPHTISIVPANAPVVTLGKHVTGVEFNDTFRGMIWDRRGTFWNTEYKKVASNPNTFDGHINYISTAAAQHCVDQDSNVIVFVIDDPSSTGYTITEEDDK